MDKLTIATKVLLKLIETDKTGFDAEGIAAYSFEIADAMQAEADKRNHVGDVNEIVEEWQPDWSVAPESANYWAMDEDTCCNWYNKEPEMIVIRNRWDFSNVLESSPSFNYQGDWKDSLRKRP